MVVSKRLPTSITALLPIRIPAGLKKATVPPRALPPADWIWLMTLPLSWIARVRSLGTMRLRTMKSLTAAPLVKVAILPAGRKSIGGPPIALSVGVQVRIALGVVTTIVSVVAVLIWRTAAPAVLTKLPWKAWAPARPAASAAAAEPIRSSARRRRRRRSGFILISRAAAGSSG